MVGNANCQTIFDKFVICSNMNNIVLRLPYNPSVSDGQIRGDVGVAVFGSKQLQSHSWQM